MVSFKDQAISLFGATVMWETDVPGVTAAAHVIARCMTGDQLRTFGAELAEQSLTDHDRQLIGSLYKAKASILKAANVWHLKALDPIEVRNPGDGSPISSP